MTSEELAASIEHNARELHAILEKMNGIIAALESGLRKDFPHSTIVIHHGDRCSLAWTVPDNVVTSVRKRICLWHDKHRLWEPLSSMDSSRKIAGFLELQKLVARIAKV